MYSMTLKYSYDFSKGTRGKCCREEAILRLPEVSADLKREAHANGLTDADVAGGEGGPSCHRRGRVGGSPLGGRGSPFQ